MTNYSLSLVQCRCVDCGVKFGCIKPVWRCEVCDRKLREHMRKKTKKEADGNG